MVEEIVEQRHYRRFSTAFSGNIAGMLVVIEFVGVTSRLADDGQQMEDLFSEALQ
jgi:hypothetical protein